MKTTLPSRGPCMRLGRTLGRGPGLALAVTVAVAFVAGGCSGKDNGPGTPENPSTPGASGSPAGSGPGQPAGGGSGSGNGSANGRSTANDLPAAVSRILTLAHDSDGATFTATYRVRLPDGKRATTTLAQQPPRFGFHVLVGKQRNVVISDGKVMHGCLSSGKGWRCTESSLDDPTEVANTYPGAVLHLIDGLVRGSGREVKVGTASRTVDGAKVQCATFTSTIEHAPPPQIYCVRKDGVLAYASTIDGQIVELTGFKPSVAAGDLAVPA